VPPPSGFRKDVPHLQVSVLAADRFERPRKKTPAICDGSSFGRNAARIIAINQIKRLQGPIERRVQLFNLFWTDFAVH